MRFDLDISGWIDNFLTNDVVQILTFISITSGIGLIIGGLNSHKKVETHNKIWCKIMILVGALMLGRNLLSLFGI